MIDPRKAFALGFLISIIYVKATFADVNPPLVKGEWAYFALWKLEANGLIEPFHANSMPIEREDITRIVADLRKRIEDGEISPKPHEIELINKLEAEFSDDAVSRKFDLRGSVAGEADYHYYNSPYRLPSKLWSPDRASLSLWGSASFNPSPGVTLYEELDIARGRETEGAEGQTASSRLNLWNWDYTADFRRAYIRFHRGGFNALLGRQPLFWGPGYGGSLMVSDNSPAFDMIFASAKFGSIKAMTFSAILDKKWNDRENPPYRYLAKRYLSGHRIDWIVNKKLELGLSEVIVYGGEARNMELQYINPLLPYYANQWNSKLDDNVLVSFDISAKPVKGLKLYCQILIDDLQYDMFSKTSHDPNAFGYIAGLYMSDPFGILRTDFRAEYTRVDTWTYTHLVPEMQYTHYGWAIGHHLGPDADQIFVGLGRMLKKDMRFKLSYAYEREGTRAISDRFKGEDYKKMKFPSGPVTKRHIAGFQFLWEPVQGPILDISWKRYFISEPWSDCEPSPTGEFKIEAGFLSRTEL